jgi:hypothetical protein
MAMRGDERRERELKVELLALGEALHTLQVLDGYVEGLQALLHRVRTGDLGDAGTVHLGPAHSGPRHVVGWGVVRAFHPPGTAD